MKGVLKVTQAGCRNAAIEDIGRARLIGVLLGFVSGNSAAHTPNLLSSVLLLLDLLSGALSLLLEAVLFGERVTVTRWRLVSKNNNLKVSNSE